MAKTDFVVVLFVGKNFQFQPCFVTVVGSLRVPLAIDVAKVFVLILIVVIFSCHIDEY